MDDAPFRITVRLHNNRIIRARERLGWKSQAEACRATGYHGSNWCALESMKDSPVDRNGDWTHDAKKMAEVLFSDPEDLWPKEARRAFKAKAVREMSFESVRALMGDPPDRRLVSTVETAESVDRLTHAMEKLTQREKRVIEARFWEEKEYAEIGKEFDLSRERARQIEQSAIGKLRQDRDMCPPATDAELRAGIDLRKGGR